MFRLKRKHKDPHAYPYLSFGLVTDHYGWSYEKLNGKWRYLIWRSVDGLENKHDDYPVSSRKTRAGAIEECHYLELINYILRKEEK